MAKKKGIKNAKKEEKVKVANKETKKDIKKDSKKVNRKQETIGNIEKNNEENTEKSAKLKKEVITSYVENLGVENIDEEEVGDLVNSSMMKYGMYVCRFRSFPALEDGFKPAQRKLLYTMYKYGMLNSRAKCQSTIGKVLEINPHAEDYGCLVRMVDTNETLRTPLIEGKGSFGKHYSSESPAAPRYTEAKLMPICHEMFDNLKRNPNNMVDNFDGTTKEPIFLSMPFPNILANPNDGIGVGYSSTLPSFNLGELCDASIEVVKNFDKNDSVLYKKVAEAMPTVDFITGGETYINDEERKKIYLIGVGKVVTRAIFNNDEKNKVLEIKEIPYSTDIDKIINSVVNVYSSKKIDEITDIRDESDISGLKIAIDYKKGTDVEELKKKLFALTPCQDTYNVNMVMVYKNSPQCIGVIGTIKHWIEHRRGWLKVTISNELEELKAKLHLLEGMQAILLDIDKAIKIVRQSNTDEEVIRGLKKAFNLDNIQAEFVADIKLRNLNKDYILNKTKEIENLKDEIKRLDDVLKNGIDKKIIDDLGRIKKTYNDDRRTKIIDKWDELERGQIKASIKEVDMDGNSLVFTSMDSVKVLNEDSKASCPSGYTSNVVANSGEILAFTNKCKVFKYVVANFKVGSMTKMSDIKKINKKMESGEHIIYTTPLIEGNKVVVIYENKKAVKFPISDYKTEGSKLCFAKGLNIKNGTPIYIESISEDKDIIVSGKTINTSEIKEVNSRTGSGAKIKI